VGKFEENSDGKIWRKFCQKNLGFFVVRNLEENLRKILSRKMWENS